MRPLLIGSSVVIACVAAMVAARADARAVDAPATSRSAEVGLAGTVGPVRLAQLAGAPEAPADAPPVAPAPPPDDAAPAMAAPEPPPAVVLTPIPVPSPAAGVDFTGVWRTIVSDGSQYRMALLQDAAGNVAGRFTPPNGEIVDGAVVGDRLTASWRQGDASGRVVLTLAAGGQTFVGHFTDTERDVDPATADGAWNGTREMTAMPAPASPPMAPQPPLTGTRSATVTTDSNVRAAPTRQSASVGSARQGTTVPILGCNDGWCRVAMTGGRQGYIAQSLLRFDGSGPGAGAPPAAAVTVMPIPPPPIPPRIPAPPPEFAGTWATITDRGIRRELVLVQDGGSIIGTYTPGAGRIAGSINADRRLVFRWEQAGGLAGMGTFELSRDSRFLSGTYSQTSNPLGIAGSWFGTRVVAEAPADEEAAPSP